MSSPKLGRRYYSSLDSRPSTGSLQEPTPTQSACNHGGSDMLAQLKELRKQVQLWGKWYQLYCTLGIYVALYTGHIN